MKLICNNCQEEVDIIVEIRGPHLKATCSQCDRYIKFLNKEERMAWVMNLRKEKTLMRNQGK